MSEALIANVGATLLEPVVAKGEHCRIAEQGGVRVGSEFLVRQDATIG
ncbi:MAG: hypothetical protein ABI120_15340 [Gemmatimonadaceae bacterium]